MEEMDFEAIEAEIIERIRVILEIEIVNIEVDKIMTKGLNESRWARPIQNKDSENSSLVSRNLQSKAAARGAGQFKGLSKLIQQPNSILSALRTRLSIGEISQQTACKNTEIENARLKEAVGEMSLPQELQEMIEVEIRRAAQAKSKIKIYATAINVAGDSLSPMLTAGNNSFTDSPYFSRGFNSAILASLP